MKMKNNQSLVSKINHVVRSGEILGLHNIGTCHRSNEHARGMLVYGGDSFLRDHGWDQLRNKYEMFWIFVPGSDIYKMCMIGFDWNNEKKTMIGVIGEGKNVSKLAQEMIKYLLNNPNPIQHKLKLLQWYLRDVLSLNKISAKDILHLSSYV